MRGGAADDLNRGLEAGSRTTCRVDRAGQPTDNTPVIQYGVTAETLRVSVLSRIRADDFEPLTKVGDAVWESTFRDQELSCLTAKRC